MHTYTCIYIYMCVCVCLCGPLQFEFRQTHLAVFLQLFGAKGRKKRAKSEMASTWQLHLHLSAFRIWEAAHMLATRPWPMFWRTSKKTPQCSKQGWAASQWRGNERKMSECQPFSASWCKRWPCPCSMGRTWRRGLCIQSASLITSSKHLHGLRLWWHQLCSSFLQNGTLFGTRMKWHQAMHFVHWTTARRWLANV